MKIAILGGTGALGLGLASRWIRSGHEVLIGSRTIESAKSACGKLKINEDQGMLNVDAANQALVTDQQVGPNRTTHILKFHEKIWAVGSKYDLNRRKSGPKFEKKYNIGEKS